MSHEVEKIPSVLHHRDIHLKLDSDRTSIDIVGIGTAVSRAFRKPRRFTFTVVLIDDVLKSLLLVVKANSQSFQC
jgi:hypothetical protein